MFALRQIALLSGYMLTCHYISLLKRSVMWLKLYWCGLVFVYHSICIVSIYCGWKRWTATRAKNCVPFPFQKTNTNSTTSDPSAPQTWSQGPSQAWKTWCSSYGFKHDDAHTKTPLDQYPKHFSMCVRAQTDPSHLWGGCIWGQAYTCWWNKTPLREETEEGFSLII